MCRCSENPAVQTGWTVLLPAHISPAPCGRSVWSEWVWLCSRNVRWSCLQFHPRPLLRLQQLQIRRLSLARPRPLPAAYCPGAWAGGLEDPPPGHHECWDLQQHTQREQRVSESYPRTRHGDVEQKQIQESVGSAWCDFSICRYELAASSLRTMLLSPKSLAVLFYLHTALHTVCTDRLTWQQHP